MVKKYNLRNQQPDGKFSSVTQLCLTLFDPMDCSTLGFPVHQVGKFSH